MTVPALTCSAPVSMNGVITVTWSYVHTGGLPLTNVSVMYTSTDLLNSTTSSPIPIPVSGVDTTSITISNLEAGLKYSFNITAHNGHGSSSIICRPIVLGKHNNSWMSMLNNNNYYYDNR